MQSLTTISDRLQPRLEAAQADARATSPDASPPAWSALRLLLVAAFAITAILYVVVSWNWKLMANPPLMHYVVFLLHRGLHPYSQITDSNMPGAYLTEAAAMAVFGTSDFGWRLYEFFLLGLMTACMVAIARRWDWIAGLVAATLFIALHGAEGAEYAGERDLVAAVLALAAAAVFLEALDRRRAAWMSIAGMACGVAASIKPTFLAFPAGFAVLAFLLIRQHRERTLPYLLWIGGGLLSVAALLLAFLLHLGALRDFFNVLLSFVPSYAAMPGGSSAWIGYRALPHRLFPLLGVALLLASLKPGARGLGSWFNPDSTDYRSVKRSWPHRNWASWTLLACACFGLLSFLVQGKGFVYHRYAFLMFTLLLVSIELVPALSRSPSQPSASGSRYGWPRWLGAASLLATLAVILPSAWINARSLGGQSDLATAFQGDLQTLGGAAALEDKVQCLDLSYGCLNALYHLRIVENSAFSGDLMLFRPQPSPSRELSRRVFWQRARADPASVLMISNQDFGVDDGFGKLDHWPEFTSYLQSRYTLVTERRFAHEHFGGKFRETVAPADQDAYRLYIRRDSPLLASADKFVSVPESAEAGPVPSTGPGSKP